MFFLTDKFFRSCSSSSSSNAPTTWTYGSVRSAPLPRSLWSSQDSKNWQVALATS